jgi:hypothetical protein
METKTMQTQPHNITLDYVKQQISNWRSNRNNKSELMSDELSTLIAKLVPLYNINDISNTLRIKPKTIHAFYKKHIKNKNSLPNEQSFDFIPIKLSSLFSNQESSLKDDGNYNTNQISNTSTECTIIKNNGTKLIIYINDPIAIIQAFICCN